MLLPNPKFKDWDMAEFTAHKPRGIAKSHTQFWGEIIHISLSRSIKNLHEHSKTPMAFSPLPPPYPLSLA